MAGLTLYSSMRPLWALWGGGSQDTLTVELLVSWTTDTERGAALKTGGGEGETPDGKKKMRFPIKVAAERDFCRSFPDNFPINLGRFVK